MQKSTSRLIAALLAIFMLAAIMPVTAGTAKAAWDGTSATSYSGGSGTADDPYIISSAAELALFRDQVNNGYKSICAKVVNDIDLNNVPWTAIGIIPSGYTGTFDGGGWAIKNLKLNSISGSFTYVDSGGNIAHPRIAGLFGKIGDDGAVKYVNVSGVVTGSLSNSKNTSLYIGSVAGANFGVIEECFATCSFTDLTVSNGNYMGIGGIVGITYKSATVKNCYYVGDINATLTSTSSAKDNQYVGGIVGYNNCSVTNCYSVSKVNINSNSTHLRKGAIAGSSYYLSSIKNCYFDSQASSWTHIVASTNDKVGGQNPDGCSGLYTSSMKAWWMPAKLGDVFKYDDGKVNSGYPTLAVMTYGETAKEDSWYTSEMAEWNLDDEILDKLVPTSLWNKDLTKNVTRAEFASVAVSLYEMLSGTTAEPAAKNPFDDTSNLDVLKAYNLGITNGVSSTQFDPYSNISRQDMATMLTRVYKALYVKGWTLATDSSYRLTFTQPEPFADDGLISSYAYESVYFMASQGILKGSDGYFRPYATTKGASVGYATREQAIITSVRYYVSNAS
jgi:hypothetical protein